MWFRNRKQEQAIHNEKLQQLAVTLQEEVEEQSKAAQELISKQTRL